VHAIQNDEHELFARLRAQPTPEDREVAVRRYLPLAHKLAATYRHSTEPMDDLEQVAALGLLNAIDRFDPDRGTTFISFAIPTILGELRRHFRDRTWAMRVPSGLQELTLRIERARDALTATLAREPTVAELSFQLATTEEQIVQSLEVALARQVFALDRPRWDDDSETDMPALLDDGFARVEDRYLLAELLATLDAKEAQIVFLRFHADLTQDVIARRIGVSQMHVSRLIRRALTRLRTVAEAEAEAV
jgi:RNA polymerase sigma-B factor